MHGQALRKDDHMTYRVAIGYILFWLIASFVGWSSWLFANVGELTTNPSDLLERHARFIGAYLAVVGVIGWPLFGLALTGLKRMGADRPKTDLLAGCFAGIVSTVFLFGPSILFQSNIEAVPFFLLLTGAHALAGAIGAIAYYAFAGQRIESS